MFTLLHHRALTNLAVSGMFMALCCCQLRELLAMAGRPEITHYTIPSYREWGG